MNTFDGIFLIIRDCCEHGEALVEESMMPKGVKIHARDLKKVCVNLHENPAVFFDMLSCITVVDNGPEAGTLEVIYNLYSIPFDLHFALKVVLPRDQAEVDTVCDVWKTANWHEREAYDMFGLKFSGHPDLRRILLPADWEGYPLRKDYRQQEYYRGVKVEF